MESGGVSYEEVKVSEMESDDVAHEKVNLGWCVKVVEMGNGENVGSDDVSYEEVILLYYAMVVEMGSDGVSPEEVFLW